MLGPGHGKLIFCLLLGQHVIMAGLLISPLKFSQCLSSIHRAALGLNVGKLSIKTLVGDTVRLVHVLGHDAHSVRHAGHAVGKVVREGGHGLNRSDRQRGIVKKLSLPHLLNRSLLSLTGLNEILLGLSNTLRRLDVILRGLVLNVPDFLFGLLYVLRALGFGVGLGELLVLRLLQVLVGLGQLLG